MRDGRFVWEIHTISSSTDGGPSGRPAESDKHSGEVSSTGDTLDVALVYPELHPPDAPRQYVEIGLEHVRAADSIRVWYDGERDGWVVEQAAVFEFEGDPPYDPEWAEVAFVPAWARERETVDDVIAGATP